ncbi:VanW family protein, partial [Patescibacteria group bacterium]|nr:VanW family protein [Patescibacteria group bacterium]
GLYVGSIPVGGMDREEVVSFLEEMNNKLSEQGITISFDTGEETKSIIVDPIQVLDVDGATIELIRIDVESASDWLLDYNKQGGWFSQSLLVLKNRATRPHLAISQLITNTEQMKSIVKEQLSFYETEKVNANVDILNIDPLEYNIVTSTIGMQYDYDRMAEKIIGEWSRLEAPTVSMNKETIQPQILEADVEGVLDRLPDIFKHGGLTISYTDPHTKQTKTWEITKGLIADWIEVQETEENGEAFGLKKENVFEFFENKLAPVINIEAEEARFQADENGKVTEFKGSRPGISINIEETYKLVNDAILQRFWHEEGAVDLVQPVIDQVEPDIKTGEINDLGIEEILGVGHSKFVGSSYWRKKNIRHAVMDKLNGRLIKPDEDFSLVNALKPFTIADGYFVEKVIKGNRIEDEVAGGLCQVGTTMFRSAMNSGLPITARTNHGLVVHYYDDLVSGNPGVDATIYDPSPDFRFLNDTGHHILISVEMIEETNDLYITFWGTNDGRKGYYSSPIVETWIGYGETINEETTDLAPGEKNCQAPFRGAIASFTYTRELPDGEVIERVFRSQYRAVPWICQVGVDPNAPPACEGTEEECAVSAIDEVISDTTEDVVDTEELAPVEVEVVE